MEKGISRIADLEALPELSSETQKFVEMQQKKVTSRVNSMQKKVQQVNKIKHVVLNDEWETYILKLQVQQPQSKDTFDIRMESNRPELHLKHLKRSKALSNYLMPKYGEASQPHEFVVKMKQEEQAPDVQGSLSKIEYTYSMKNFETQEIVHEREPYRLIEIQDPLLYRGELGFQKSSFWKETHKAFIVNGRLERADGNF